MLQHIIKPLVNYMQGFLIDEITKGLNNSSTLRLRLLIGYLVLVAVIVFVWQKFLLYLHKIDLSVRRMVAILPLDVIFKINRIYKYLVSVTQKNH